ncbi:MAG: endonuclease [Brumimicrobium sp.]|nr:endonuclease [Brumimicrobium sp.]
MKTLKAFTLGLSLSLLALQANSQNVIHLEEFSGSSGSWTAVDFSEPANQWSFANGYAEIYGASGADDDDWLISPVINLNAQENEYIQFEYLDQFTGPYIELKYSTDYNGSGATADIINATWVDIDTRVLNLNTFSCFSTLLQKHPAINISNIQGNQVYFAFRYYGFNGEHKEYRLDNIQITADYYGAVDTSLRCFQLKSDILQTIQNQTYVTRYTSTVYDVWDALLHTDSRVNDAGTDTIVFDMFTNVPTGPETYEFEFCVDQDAGSCPSGEGQCFNREHTLPVSWWGGGTTLADTQFTDLHHVVPSDRSLNSAKSNYPLGVVENAVTTGSNGFKVGTNSTYPCNAMLYFEPIDEYKGDYARIYLYMATRYQDVINSWETLTAEGDCALGSDPHLVYEPWLLDLLLTWHANDPVSQKEIDRNNAVYAIQGNRNPYVDHPEWVNLVFGDENGGLCSEVGLNEWDKNQKLTGYPNPAENEFTLNIPEGTSLANMEMYNIVGKQVPLIIRTNTSKSVTVDLSHLEPGSYIIRTIYGSMRIIKK